MSEDSGFGKAWKVITAIAGLYCALYTGQDALGLFYKHQPNTSQVQNGYVVPSKLEIELGDLDRNGRKETLMKYDGKTYLLKLDEQGRPQVQAYEIKPAEVVPKRE